MMSSDAIHNEVGGESSSAAVVSPPVKPASSTISASTVEPVTSTVNSADSTVAERRTLSDVGPARRPQRRSILRRCRTRRRLEGSQHRNVQAPNSHLRESERRLAEIINQRATATMEYTNAMRKLTAAADRLTAVMDRLTTIFSQPLTRQIHSSSSPPVRKFSRIITPSDSDSD